MRKIRQNKLLICLHRSNESFQRQWVGEARAPHSLNAYPSLRRKITENALTPLPRRREELGPEGELAIIAYTKLI